MILANQIKWEIKVQVVTLKCGNKKIGLRMSRGLIIVVQTTCTITIMIMIMIMVMNYYVIVSMIMIMI